jgi:AcrR family transcriptional regulator
MAKQAKTNPPAKKPRKRKAKTKTDPLGAIIAATMTLAAERPWREITLAAIAREADMPLAQLRAQVRCKGDILRALAARTDEALLASMEKEPLEGDATDRLFEAVMRRLEIMAPWKEAIGNIMHEPASAACECPPVIEQYFISNRWMLAAAGLEKSGMEGLARTMGLSLVYARALRAWVEDDDPGLSHTMARLDRDLKRGARILKNLQGPALAARSACRLTRSVLRAAARAMRPAGNAASAASSPEAEPESVQP